MSTFTAEEEYEKFQHHYVRVSRVLDGIEVRVCRGTMDASTGGMYQKWLFPNRFIDFFYGGFEKRVEHWRVKCEKAATRIRKREEYACAIESLFNEQR